MIVILSSLLVLVPLLHYHIVGIALTILSTLNSLLLMTLTLRGLMRRQREAYFYAAAWSSLLVGAFTYGLLSLGFIQPNFFTEKGLQLGSFFEVTILSFALADCLNQLQIGLKDANSRLGHYLQHVEEQVMLKTREIRSIMEHIPMGVFSIIPGLKVHKDHSHHMQKLFHRRDCEGMDAIELLFAHALIDADQKSQMTHALQLSIGEDRLAFELNRHCLVEQVETRYQDTRRTLHMLWNPVCNEAGIVEKVLVTVHDVTRLLMLEVEASSQRQELTIIRRILDVSTASFHSFIRKAEQLLQECESMLEERQETFKKVLLIHIHTLKGMARSVYLNDIAEHCHQIEDSCAKASQDELKSLLQDLHSAVEAGTDLLLIFADDGRRLNVQGLKDQGLRRGLIAQNASLATIADLVFQPQVSTRSSVSHLSGRGIGLAAVRDYLRREGGDAVIRLATEDLNLDFVPFSVEIHLPKSLWTRLHPMNFPLSA
jgi:HPt (histidine-containing phosphotransfer) domain-containing protein